MENISKEKKFAAFVSIISNTFLIVLKLVVGVISGSVSIISEAIHSMSDLIASFLAFFSVAQSAQPADDCHQYGHGKFEDFSGFFEGLLIFAAAVYIVYEAISKVVHHQISDIEPTLGIVVMAISVVVNFIISGYIFKIGKKTDSIALIADAEHLRTDIITSVGVLVGLIAIKITKISIIDPAIAIFVAILIFKTAIGLCRESAANLLDGAIAQSDVGIIQDTIKEYIPQRISELKKMKTRKAGNQRIIDLVLSAPGNLSLKEGHDLCDEIENAIQSKIENSAVFIHLEPAE